MLKNLNKWGNARKWSKSSTTPTSSLKTSLRSEIDSLRRRKETSSRYKAKFVNRNTSSKGSTKKNALRSRGTSNKKLNSKTNKKMIISPNYKLKIRPSPIESKTNAPSLKEKLKSPPICMPGRKTTKKIEIKTFSKVQKIQSRITKLKQPTKYPRISKTLVTSKKDTGKKFKP